jgi:hypothetical protein
MAAEGDDASRRRRPVAGGDWSVGLNAPTSLSHARLLLDLGRRLRPAYDDLFSEPVPEHLAQIARRLDRQPDCR